MTVRGDPSSRVAVATATAVDAVVYAAAVTGAVTAAAFALTVLTGGDLVRVKTLLFVAGWALVSYGTFRLWPRSPADVEPDNRSPVQTGRIQRTVESVPPLRWFDAAVVAKRQLSQAGKLFLGGVGALLVSLLLEVAGGVG
ncbi:hypothetical protein GJ629_03420 [Halapricum sp. CBA1109]|uniref:DUF7555 family protein n=1 Tax=Halapricum sp. CBA1109 TaxID=2668068 RepID=UPI0012FB9289|nr:hypothetical protein [Halapricum sp. CBA1109]MUV89065.1 hypothetical protein [Halapricum sp. CBA1109]